MMGRAEVRKRLKVVLSFLFVCFALILARLVYVQIIWAQELSQMALDMRMNDIPIQPKRGIIVDRNGHELAFSIDVESLYAIPSQIKDPVHTAEVLSDVLGMDYEKVLAILTRTSGFEWIKRKLPDDIVRKIKELNLQGIGFTQESMRVWPKGTLLAQVLGIVGIDNDGLEGLEYQYDDLLRGTPGKFTVEVDALGNIIPQSEKGYIPPSDGKNLVLTIDEPIQFIVERELDKRIAESNAAGGVVVAMDPSNGEILALAIRPGYDPNNYDEYPAANRRIKAVTDSFPPGSTFKPVTGAIGLECGSVKPTDVFYCNGSLKVGVEILHCNQSIAHGKQTFVQVIQNSCNVGFVQIAQKIGIEDFYHYADLFGITSCTGIDLPGESAGIIVPKDQAREIDLAVMSYGQTLQTTPIQIVTAVSAIANGGDIVVPHVVKEVTDAEGNVVESASCEPVRQVISEQTAQEMRLALEKVVSEGTGKSAYVPGYRLAGKTGTSNKVVDGKIAQDKYISSFVGFAPANDPQVVLLVMIDEPKGDYYGGVIAAPVFSSIMRDMLRYLEIPPQEEVLDIGGQDVVKVPNLVGKPVDTALNELNHDGFTVRTEGSGGTVLDQFPVAGSKVIRGTDVVLYTEGDEEPGEGMVRVPSIVGLGMTQARAKLKDSGLSLSAEGNGFCVTQEPQAGKIVPVGTTVKAVFRMDVGQ